MTVTYLVGDTRDIIATCSPPFVALRSYLPADHPDKHREIGSEPDPATFVDTLLALTAEWGRVLAPWGSIAIELGDTYAGGGGGGGDYLPGGFRDGQQQFAGSTATMRESNAAHWRAKNQPTAEWPRAKSLALVPEAYRLSLAYGRNVLNGQPSPAGRWLVRNVITWHRPNPGVGALGDKFRPSTSQIVVATRHPKRWFDLTAVRTAYAPLTVKVKGDAWVRGETSFDNGPKNTESGQTGNPMATSRATHAGAPPLDCWFDEWDGTPDTWTITTQPSRLAHYAMWPAKIAERLILSMCPREVCAQCGEPRRRIESAEYVPHGGDIGRQHAMPRAIAAQGSTILGVGASFKHGRATKIPTTLDWTDCGHDAYQPGLVLDPFAGTGTTLAVADLHGRDAIGIDIDPRNRDLYPARRVECARNLFDTRPELPGQVSLFDEATA
jgi:hypothetical protein